MGKARWSVRCKGKVAIQCTKWQPCAAAPSAGEQTGPKDALAGWVQAKRQRERFGSTRDSGTSRQHLCQPSVVNPALALVLDQQLAPQCMADGVADPSLAGVNRLRWTELPRHRTDPAVRHELVEGVFNDALCMAAPPGKQASEPPSDAPANAGIPSRMDTHLGQP